MDACLKLLRNNKPLLEALATEAASPSRNIQRYSYYQYPDFYQLGLLDRTKSTQTCPIVALIHAQIITSMSLLANHLRFGNDAITLGGISDAIHFEIDFDDLIITEEDSLDAVKPVFDRFVISVPENTRVVRVTDTDFLIGDWWYGSSRDIAFFARHIRYKTPDETQDESRENPATSTDGLWSAVRRPFSS